MSNSSYFTVFNMQLVKNSCKVTFYVTGLLNIHFDKICLDKYYTCLSCLSTCSLQDKCYKIKKEIFVLFFSKAVHFLKKGSFS